MRIAIVDAMKRLAALAGAFVAPQLCRSCGRALLGDGNPYLCPVCLAGVRWIGEGACQRCGYPAGPHARLGRGCSRCRGGRLALSGAAAVASYRGAVRGLVLALKFRGETCLAKPMAALMAERLRRIAFPACDFILPVALHSARLRTRGFDQALLLARRLSPLIGVKVSPDALRRVRDTRPQSLLRAAARHGNVQGAFAVGRDLSGARVLLVDDVMTTGATMGECARACRRAGASRVYALTFAR